jgi:group I intron endonuclease
LLKHDYDNFKLEIIEYCEPNLLIKREQYYIDLINPECNICKVTGSSLGRKHSSETITRLKAYIPSKEILAKLMGRKYSFETIAKLRLLRLGRKHIFETLIKFINRKHSDKSIAKIKSYITKVTNIKAHSFIEYYSIREVARKLGVSDTRIRKYINTGEILKNTYIITKK